MSTTDACRMYIYAMLSGEKVQVVSEENQENGLAILQYIATSYFVFFSGLLINHSS